MKKVFALILIIIAFIAGLYTYKYYFNDKEKQTTKSQEEKQVIEDIIDEIDTKYDTDTQTKTEETKEKESENKEKTGTEYDQYFVANGFAGASDNVYYTKDNVLYHLILSTNKKIKVAEGVDKMENDLGTIIVYKGKNFKIYVEDNYLTYVD